MIWSKVWEHLIFFKGKLTICLWMDIWEQQQLRNAGVLISHLHHVLLSAFNQGGLMSIKKPNLAGYCVRSKIYTDHFCRLKKHQIYVGSFVYWIKYMHRYLCLWGCVYDHDHLRSNGCIHYSGREKLLGGLNPTVSVSRSLSSCKYKHSFHQCGAFILPYTLEMDEKFLLFTTCGGLIQGGPCLCLHQWFKVSCCSFRRRICGRVNIHQASAAFQQIYSEMLWGVGR